MLGFEQIEHLVNILSTDSGNSFIDFDHNDLVRFCQTEKAQIKLRITEKVVRANNEESIFIIIRYAQTELSMLLEITNKRLRIIENHLTSTYKILSAISRCLIEVLEFLESDFSTYLNLDQIVNTEYLQEYKTSILDDWQAVCAILLVNRLDPNINSIIEDWLNEFFIKENMKITYREYLFTKTLISRIKSLEHVRTPKSMHKALETLLLELNFNSSKMINHFVDCYIQLPCDVSEIISIQGSQRI